MFFLLSARIFEFSDISVDLVYDKNLRPKKMLCMSNFLLFAITCPGQAGLWSCHSPCQPTFVSTPIFLQMMENTIKIRGKGNCSRLSAFPLNNICIYELVHVRVLLLLINIAEVCVSRD